MVIHWPGITVRRSAAGNSARLERHVSWCHAMLPQKNQGHAIDRRVPSRHIDDEIHVLKAVNLELEMRTSDKIVVTLLKNHDSSGP